MYWQSRQLSRIDVGSYYNSYFYNENGIRTRKSIWEDVSGEAIDVSYIIDSSKILKETRTSNYYSSDTLYYYDASGSITGFNYNGTTYYYGKNVQGDIKYIYNTSGTIVTEYCYDAWGNILSVTGSMASTVGAINPFRYRGYYYDTETGFYYLNSRYYNPQVGRFINADGIIGANRDLVSYNLFAYCSNNPVNRVDISGYASISIWDNIASGLQTAWDSTKDWVVNAWEDTSEWVSNAWDDTKDWFKNVYEDTSKWIGNAYEDTKAWIEKAWEDTCSWVVNALEDTGNFIKRLTTDPVFKGVSKIVMGTAGIILGIGEIAAGFAAFAVPEPGVSKATGIWAFTRGISAVSGGLFGVLSGIGEIIEENSK